LCPAGAKGDRGAHKEVSLVYFSTFEPIELTPDSIMQLAGVPMLYDTASNPRLSCLYICPLKIALWQTCWGAPPSFRASSAAIGSVIRHPTIRHRFKDDRGDTSVDTIRDKGNGSRLYEADIRMWRYDRGRARMVSIAEAGRMRS
jgi:hypothetical protein